MSLITPLGPLDHLDLTSNETLNKLLRQDKHQVLEGLIVEGYFRQFVDLLRGQGTHTLPIALAKSTLKNHDGSWRTPAWWLWSQDKDCNGLSVLESKLTSGRGVIVKCDYDSEQRDFIMKSWGDKPVGEPVQLFMMRHRHMQQLTYQMPARKVSQEERYMQAYWGGLKGVYGSSLFEDVILHRLFKNCAISPFFTALWDVDNIVQLPSGELMQFEVKHKYPFERDGELFFGINKGQLGVMQDLAWCGIDTLHMILVKPKWTDNLSPGYLLHDPSLRSQVLLVGYRLDARKMQALRNSAGGTSANKTSLDGRRTLNYVNVAVENFQLIGSLDDPLAELASKISLAADGLLTSPISADILKSAQVVK